MVSEKIAPVGGECATATFDTAGRLITVCGTSTGFLLKLLDPRTLDTLAEYKLPQRSSTVEAITRLDFSRIFKDTSGGAYFYLDDQGRIVLADSRQHVLRIAHRQNAAGRWEFVVENDRDLTGQVPHDCVSWTDLFPSGTCDPATSVMPYWQGRIWWVTRLGRVGTVDPETSVIRSVRLADEEIQNSFSVARDGVSIVSDHALYSFTADPDGTPRIQWRQTYDRATGPKPGSVNQGSGTTPDLFGTGEEYVAITDNADDRMNVLVYRRATDVPADRRLVCSVPVFGCSTSTRRSPTPSASTPGTSPPSTSAPVNAVGASRPAPDRRTTTTGRPSPSAPTARRTRGSSTASWRCATPAEPPRQHTDAAQKCTPPHVVTGAHALCSRPWSNGKS